MCYFLIPAIVILAVAIAIVVESTLPLPARDDAKINWPIGDSRNETRL
jgi:hypothetical protein